MKDAMIGVIAAVLLVAVPEAWAGKPLLLTLDQAQATALEHNQMLKAARAQVDRAKAIGLQTWAGHLPSIRVSEGATRSNDAVNAFGFRLKQERFSQADFAISALNYPAAITNFETKVEIRQPLFNGGQAFYGRRQARAGVKIASSELGRSEAQVRFETAKAYWGVVLAQEALLAVQQGLETARAHAKVAESRYREQAADLADLLAARVRVAELQGDEITAQNNLDEAVDGLALMMGMDIGVTLRPSDELKRVALPDSLENLVARAGQVRPDLAAAKAQAEGAEQGVGVARAALLPHLNAFADLALDTDKMFTRKGESWTVGAMMSWDLFAGGKSIGALKEARAQREAARAMAAFKASDVAREVRAAFRSTQAADAQVSIAEDALKDAEERLRITQLQYQEGLATSTDLLTAESELRHARVRRIQALYNLNVGISSLEFTVGESVK